MSKMTTNTQSLTDGNRRQLSKFMSGALRHFPSDVGLTLDEYGWVDKNDLANACERKYDWFSAGDIDYVVETDSKGRFESHGQNIRATYGHSVDVTVESKDRPIPNTLYHGTVKRNLDSIYEQGLKSMDRLFVHLTDEPNQGLDVADRHDGNSVLLQIDAGSMQEDGMEIMAQGNVIYVTEHVPPRYIEEH